MIKGNKDKNTAVVLGSCPHEMSNVIPWSKSITYVHINTERFESEYLKGVCGIAVQPGFLYVLSCWNLPEHHLNNVSLIITKIFLSIEILAMKKSQLGSRALFIHLAHDQQVILEFCVDNKMKLIL